MEVLLWAARAMHLFAVVLWLGSLLYMSVIVIPGLDDASDIVLHQLKLFVPLQWMGLLTILVTGSAMMLFDPRFIFFSYPDWWSVALGLKQLLFVLIGIFAFGYARMAANVVAAGIHTEPGGPYRSKLVQFFRVNVFMGIVSLLLAASMN